MIKNAEDLEALGIRWVRHGADGEYIPKNVTVATKKVKISHAATSQHRGMCLEGADSRENLIDNIDRCAKMADYCVDFIEKHPEIDVLHSLPRKQKRHPKDVSYSPILLSAYRKFGYSAFHIFSECLVDANAIFSHSAFAECLFMSLHLLFRKKFL